MFVQHMVAVLRQGGMVCTVMPHGVLFRGGAEKDIRKGFIDDDLLEAVIGLAPNLFYGTGIPACILVLRAKGAKAQTRRQKVLFVNADAEFRAGRAQNYLEAEHIEKVVNAFERFEDIPGFARVVSKAELAENDFNLNLRRYADNAPPPEPHDVRAHLVGGVPKAEVEAKAQLFAAHGFDPSGLLVERDARYFDFAPSIDTKADIKRRVEHDEGVTATEARLREAFDTWWDQHKTGLVQLPTHNGLMRVRAELQASFEAALAPVGLLDRFQVAGAVATWWGEVVYDLKTLMARGFEGVVEGWVTTIVTALEDDGNKADPLDHKLVKRLLPELLDAIADLEGRVAELDGTLKAAKASENGEDEEDEPEEENEDALSEAELKALKSELTAAKKKLKALRQSFSEKLQAAQAEVDAERAQALVLELLRGDLIRELDRKVVAHRQEVVAAVEAWWDKYRVTLRDVEAERDAAKTRLDGLLRELGYA